MDRRCFIKTGSLAAGSFVLAAGCQKKSGSIPPHLEDYSALYAENPRKASVEWFRNAKFGLFMHYGLYSLIGRGEWVMLREKIPLAEYEKLKDKFTAEKFDADFITDLALEAGMKYVNMTAKHHDSFCLFKSSVSDYNSVNSPAKRDLVGELAAACQKKKLGCFFYYSLGADWRHPWFYSREVGWHNARPAYDTPEPRYLFKEDKDFVKYIEFAHTQIKELLTNYGPLAGIWLDPIMGYYARPDLFPIDETYAMIRSLQPHCLISFKQGANGDEDFVAPERKAAVHSRGGEVGLRAWELNKNKPREICDTLQPRVWGYSSLVEGKHKTADEVMAMLKAAEEQGANLLLNTGPLGDGSIHADDVAALKEVGRRLRAAGGLG